MRRCWLVVGCFGALALAAVLEAAEIRQFDLRTIESLGRQLYEQLQSGRTPNALQARAEESARRAVHLDARYRFAVLDDPDGSGFLVYAIATSSNRNDIVVGKHFRITVSADGSKVERVDALSQGDYTIPRAELTTGKRPVAFWWRELVGDKPVETLVYLTLLHGQPCYVGTPDRSFWKIEDGKITKIH